MPELTDRQAEVLGFILDNLSVRGPTFREVAAFIGSPSPNAAMCHVKALEAKGVLRRPSSVVEARCMTPEHCVLPPKLVVKFGDRRYRLVEVNE